MAAKPPPTARHRTGLTDHDVAHYFKALDRAVDRTVRARATGPLEHERLRVAAWIHQVYRNPLSSAVFARAAGPAMRAARRAQAEALARRLTVVPTSLTPPVEVWSTAATAALWAVTEDAVTRCPRPPCGQVVADAWSVMRATLVPARARSHAPLPFVRAKGAW